MNCHHCGALTDNGLALCELCRAAASKYLEYLPVYFRNLARWRPGRAGSRQVPGSREPQGPSPASMDRISRALDEAMNALTTWARALEDDRGIQAPDADSEAEQAEALCRWLNVNLTSIATLEWCGEFMRHKRKDEETCESIGYHEWRLRRLTETAAPGWYAGLCTRRLTMEDRCGAPTYVIPGLTWVTCVACGSTTYARDHLETILDEASDWVARPRALAEAIVALVDTEQSVPRLYERIHKWGQRERIAVVRASEYAPKKYRLGDVLGVLFAEGATRLDEVGERMGA